LNHPSVLAARGINIDDAQRYSLLREVASGLAFLHIHGVCIGDISPKNLLFSLGASTRSSVVGGAATTRTVSR
jgi:eukaryotic-like serine/threonine-protein kinase